MANPFENQTAPEVGKAVFCTPVWEADPKHPTRQRAKRTGGDTGDVVYTPDSLAAYEAYRTRLREQTAALGPAVTDPNPVLAFYRVEWGYQKDPTTVRPKAGPHAARQEIPKDVLKLLERETAERKR